MKDLYTYLKIETVDAVVLLEAIYRISKDDSRSTHERAYMDRLFRELATQYLNNVGNHGGQTLIDEMKFKARAVMGTFTEEAR